MSNEEDIGLFVERLRDAAEDWRNSDELIGLVVRGRWPQVYEFENGGGAAACSGGGS